MARIDKRRAKGARTNAPGVKASAQSSAAQRKRGAGGSIEDTMFFPRLRRHTKWMFVALALVFGLGFVIFGVGASGSGLGDLFQNHQSGGGGVSVKSALEATQKRPNDPKAWQDLSTAYQTKGDIDGALDAQSHYTQLAPKNVDALRELGSLYLSQAQQKSLEAQDAFIRGRYSGAVSPAGVALTVKSQPVYTDPLAAPLTSAASADYSIAAAAASTALQTAVLTYQKVATLTPTDPNAQIDIANAARSAGDVPTEIKAYRRYLKLAPDDPSAPAVRQQLKLLTKTTKPAQKAKPAKAKSG